MTLLKSHVLIFLVGLFTSQVSASKDESYDVRHRYGGCKSRCGAGRECVLGDDGKTKCICARACKKHYRPVCGDDGILYISHCELHRRACVSKQHVTVDHTNKCTRTERICTKDNLTALQLRMLAIIVKETTGKYKTYELVEKLFTQYDVDDDRNLDKYELSGMLDDHTVYKPMRNLLLRCEGKDWIKSADHDANYRLSLAEFTKQFEAYSQGSENDKRTKSIKAREGRSVSLPTVLAGIEVEWKQDGKLVNFQNTDRYSILRNGSLLISPVYVDDSGTYTSCVKDVPSYCQTTLLEVGAPPLVHLTPADPVVDEGLSVVFECIVKGTPTPNIYWEREGEVYQEHNGPLHSKRIEIQSARAHDSGLYSCVANNKYGTSSDKSLLTVRTRDGSPTINTFAVLAEDGVYLIDPETTSVIQTVGGDTVIKGTNKPICHRHKAIKCRWGPAVNVRNKYLYASDITGSRIIVFDANSLVPVEEITTVQPVREMRYVEIVDKVLVIARRFEDVDNEGKMDDQGYLLIIPQASQDTHHASITMAAKKDNHKINPGRIEVPPCSSSPNIFTSAFVSSLDTPGFNVLDLQYEEYKMFVNMSSFGCKRIHSVVHSYTHDYAFVQCEIDDEYEVVTQFVVDMTNTSNVQQYSLVTGNTRLSPDGKYAVTLSQTTGNLFVQHIDNHRELHFLGNIYTTVMLSEVAFYPRSSGYDVYVTAKDHASIVVINIDNNTMKTLKVLLNVGMPYKGAFDWEDVHRTIALGCDNDTHYAASPATADHKVVIIDLEQRLVKGTITEIKPEDTVVFLKRI